MTGIDYTHINTKPLEIEWVDVLSMVSLAYYQGLMVEMTKGTEAPVEAPSFTMPQLNAMRKFLGENACELGDEFMMDKIRQTVVDHQAGTI